MSSSGVIYAIIVGAWAVYLVPMWLRREDELNRARQTQRYAAAIKVLANKEAFERRWAQSGESDEALPIAVGQNFAPASRAPQRGTETKSATASKSTKTAPPSAKPKSAPASRPAIAATTSTKQTVTASITDRKRAAAKPTPQRPAQPATAPKSPGPRTGLMARRRRVVGLLFTASTLGALISADLGAQYLWAMATPAVLLSAYIVWLRRDEQVRAAARARRRAAAQVAREAREVRDAADQQARKDAEAAHVAAELAQAELEHQLRTQAARRRSAAARARAQVYSQEAPDLRQASNG
jgi:hypothetical protein